MIASSETETTPTTEGVKLTEFDPKREIEGVHPKIRSCKSCIHASVCKIYEVQAIHVQRLAEMSKRSNITLDITPPEAIGVGCSEYESGTIKTDK